MHQTLADQLKPAESVEALFEGPTRHSEQPLMLALTGQRALLFIPGYQRTKKQNPRDLCLAIPRSRLSFAQRNWPYGGHLYGEGTAAYGTYVDGFDHHIVIGPDLSEDHTRSLRVLIEAWGGTITSLHWEAAQEREPRWIEDQVFPIRWMVSGVVGLIGLVVRILGGLLKVGRYLVKASGSRRG